MSAIASVTAPDSLIQVNTVRQQVMSAEKQLPPAPASALAIPIDTARAEVNQAAFLPALMAPSADGIFTIGSVAVKLGSVVKAVSQMSGTSSWGF